jgi:hypothetical protein
MEMNMYETSPEHALEYGLIAKKPLYLIGVFYIINQNLLKQIDEYAKENGIDLVFGHIYNLLNIELIKYWLHDNGYAVNQENNDFYKLIKILE